METELTVEEEFSVPEIRERLRRAYRRLAKEAQKRADMQTAAPPASSSAGEAHAPHEQQRQAYKQERMF